MSKHQSRTRIPGDDYLPDLALKMPIRQSHSNPEALDMVSIDLLQQRLPDCKTARWIRSPSLIDDVHRKSNHKSLTPSNPEPHLSHGFELGSVPRPTRDNYACASCSQWSLACVHAPALNDFDGHNSNSSQRQAATTTQHPRHLLQSHGGLGDASHHPAQHTRRSLDPPMLRRWLRQSPRQEGFNGEATAQAPSANVAKGRL